MELAILVSGKGQQPEQKPTAQESKTPIRHLKFNDENGKVKKLKAIKRSGVRKVRPEFAIPMNDAEFQEF
ncbi:MAG: hypothetical protein HQK60_20320, partial [Deltaproteobacteria bacterium]|nr:hypothetical protein [Deltaproteobacteria bacterium]